MKGMTHATPTEIDPASLKTAQKNWLSFKKMMKYGGMMVVGILLILWTVYGIRHS